MVTFVCVNAGNYLGRGAEYVNILCNSIMRNLPDEHKFICFTDDSIGINPLIECRPITEKLNGWWNKLYMFKEGALTKDDGRIVYFDLDTCIVSSLDEIIKYAGKFAILRDFYRPMGLGSGVMMWEGGDHTNIWQQWDASGRPEITGGDQAWLEIYFRFDGRDILQEFYPQCFVSYKMHAKELIPKSAKVVCFHGDPRPHDADGWVPYIWKINGGSSLEFVTEGNTSEEVLIQNIQSNIKLPNPLLQRLEPHDGVAAVVGGGPSLASSYIPEDYTVFATNNSWRLLPKFDYHVMLDARPENAEFVSPTGKRLYASQVWPNIITPDVTLWHSYADGIQEIIKDDPRETVYVGGGSSVGLKAIVIAFLLGYRKIHIYGMDSSYDGDTHHAYSQPLNDNEKVIEVTCNDKQYKVAPWMVTQVDEFKDLAGLLVSHGCELIVHGYGLLPDVAHSMSVVPEIVWPEGDIEGKHHGVAEVHNIPAIVSFCKKTDYVIQAGGNVGLWPREYAKIFKEVHSFEPDPKNAECFLKNCPAENVSLYPFALGEESKTVRIQHDERNCGASHIVSGSDMAMVCLDDFIFEGCDLLQFDVEGYELMALKGAVKLINKYSPVICLEYNSCASRYGYDFDDLSNWLRGMGYQLKERIANDYIFTKGD